MVKVSVCFVRGHGNGIFSMVAKGQRLYSGSRDATIRVWDMDALKRGCIHTLQGHTNTVCVYY